MTETIVSSIPALHAFDPRTTTWQSYRDRIGFYFKANRILEESDKKPLFLWAIGDSTYNLLESLISPKTLTDNAITYKDIIKLLDVHYDIRKNIMTSTYDFYSCTQKPDQSFNDWKAELCEKLRYCCFTTSKLATKPQDRALRDMYVIGVRSQKIRQALLKEEDPDLETTEKIIQTAERLQEDVRHFNSNMAHTDGNVAKIERQQHTNKPRQQTKPHTNQEKTPCGSCGSTQHARGICKYREFTCNFCKRVGHLERVCRQKKDTRRTTKHITTVLKVQHTTQVNKQSNNSPNVTLLINNYEFDFEMDTGSTYTIISERDWKRIGSPTIHQSTHKLKCYSGQTLKILGECDVNINYKDQNFSLSLIVVHGDGLPLLGLIWIKSLQLDMNSIVHGTNHTFNPINKLYDQNKLDKLLNKYKNVLSNELGHCTKVKAQIHLKPEAIPKFHKPRPIPFAYLDGVKEEIMRNVKDGILERVETSAWAAPIVPVKKPNGKIRVCGDFKVTINSQMWIDQHPIPTIDELLTRLNNGKRFTKIDLSDAYLQIELDDDSKKLVVINTPLGLYQYNRMPFGIANAPAIFQRTIDQVIAGIPNCAAYLDDILITGANDEDHFQTLEMVLTRLSEFNLRCNPAKCSFFAEKVSYLGFIIDENGKRPDPQRIEAIIKMPPPNNVRELETFIGKVNYYGQFISNFADKCAPLNRLRRNHVSWQWNRTCQDAFEHLKHQIAKATTLEHFDAKLPIILATDASNYGIGAVIMHRNADGSERPIAHASKTLTNAEKNYSQIEKEALSIVYGVKKFHQYPAGRNFELVTDHQPLLTIFNPSKGIPMTTANRLQRWALCLMAYTYTIRYKPSQLHANADALSRLPAGLDPCFVDNDSCQVKLIQEQLVNEWPVQPNQIRNASSKDKILKVVISFTLTNWPSSVSTRKQPELIPYYNNRHCLSVLEGCLMKDNQVVIPQELQRRVLHMLHRSHLGTVKMKQLARSHCWWPNMHNDILEMTRKCSICAKLQRMPNQQFNEWPEPEQVWSRVHMDFAGPVWGSKWLIMIDAKSKFPIVADMGNNTTATKLCDVLEQVIDWFGPPEVLVSDNGPPFTSYEMKQFYQYYGITHLTSAPYHPASNGLAERFVRTFKDGLEKEKLSGQLDKHIAVRNVMRTYRWSTHTTTGRSPAEMILQYPIRTALHRMKPVKPVSKQQQQRVSKYQIGQMVLTKVNQPNNSHIWQSGIITKQMGSILYEVQLPDGFVKRHQNQLRLQYGSISQQSDTTSLPDDLLNDNSSKQSQRMAQPTAPRYPTRIRKPPERYTPT